MDSNQINQQSSQTIATNQSVVNVPSQVEQNISSGSSNKNLFLLMFIVCLIGICIGIIFYLKTANSQSTVKDTSLIPSISLSDNSLLTYKGKKVKYSFVYPKIWPISELPVGECVLCVERLIFAPTSRVIKQGLKKGSDARSLGYKYTDEYAFVSILNLNLVKINIIKSFEAKVNAITIQAAKYKAVTDIDYLTIGGEEAISYKYTKMYQNILKEYWVLKDGYEYRFVLYKGANSNDDSKRMKIFTQILSSFQFL